MNASQFKLIADGPTGCSPLGKVRVGGGANVIELHNDAAACCVDRVDHSLPALGVLPVEKSGHIDGAASAVLLDSGAALMDTSARNSLVCFERSDCSWDDRDLNHAASRWPARRTGANAERKYRGSGRRKNRARVASAERDRDAA